MRCASRAFCIQSLLVDLRMQACRNGRKISWTSCGKRASYPQSRFVVVTRDGCETARQEADGERPSALLENHCRERAAIAGLAIRRLCSFGGIRMLDNDSVPATLSTLTRNTT